MNRVRRALGPFLFSALVLLAAPACDDQRGPVTPQDNGVLNADSIFQSAIVFTGIYNLLNTFAETVVEIHDGGGTTPVQINSDCGIGRAIVTDAQDSDPLTYRVTFTDFQIDCGTPLPLVVSTNTEVEAALFVTLVETSPGLQYTIFMPFDFATATPKGLTVQLPSDIGIDLEVTTPTGALVCTLDGDRAGGPGLVRQRGTVRFEEAGNVTFVQEVALDYGFDDTASPRFDRYPSGTYEIGSFGGFGFDRGPGVPVDVSFDGEGGLTYSFEGMSCTADMSTFSNPCGDN